MTSTWVLNKKTGKWEAKSDKYRHPKPKEKKKHTAPKKKSKSKKVDKKIATAYYGQKQMDLAAMKKSRL